MDLALNPEWNNTATKGVLKTKWFVDQNVIVKIVQEFKSKL